MEGWTPVELLALSWHKDDVTRARQYLTQVCDRVLKLREPGLRQTYVPTVPSLMKICDGFGITLAQFFFLDCDNAKLSEDKRQYLARWNALDPRDKKLALAFMAGLTAGRVMDELFSLSRQPPKSQLHIIILKPPRLILGGYFTINSEESTEKPMITAKISPFVCSS